MAKHFALSITEDSFSYARRDASIAREGRLDGLYVIRTSVPAAAMSAEETVRAYKDLARVEQAFRAIKAMDLQIRLVHHWIEPRVRAHVSCACWPTTSRGICARPGRRSCFMTTTERRRSGDGSRRWLQPKSPTLQNLSAARGAAMTVSRSAASAA
jgi:hypothetical protein